MNPTGSASLDIRVSGDSKYVFTLNSGAETIGVFAVQSRALLTAWMK